VRAVHELLRLVEIDPGHRLEAPFEPQVVRRQRDAQQVEGVAQVVAVDLADQQLPLHWATAQGPGGRPGPDPSGG
jgi:hypothetical protein